MCSLCSGHSAHTPPKLLAAEDVLASAKAILADIRVKETGLTSGDTGLVEKYCSQIAAFDTEVQDMKKQIDWYAEQLDKREQTIAEMRGKVAGLTASNEELSSKIKDLEGAVVPTKALPPPNEGVCVRCALL